MRWVSVNTNHFIRLEVRQSTATAIRIKCNSQVENRAEKEKLGNVIL